MNIKKWYAKEYHWDDITPQLNDEARAIDVVFALEAGICVYDVLGVHDSIVRERVFLKLSEMLQVDYNDIYEKWLSKPPKPITITNNEVTQ